MTAGQKEKAAKRKPKPPKGPGLHDAKQVHAVINHDGSAALNDLGKDQGLSMEEMIVRALNAFLAAHGKPACIERRYLRKDVPRKPLPGELSGAPSLPLGVKSEVVGEGSESP